MFRPKYICYMNFTNSYGANGVSNVRIERVLEFLMCGNVIN